MDIQSIHNIIYTAIDELQALFPHIQLEKSPETVLYGEDSPLDSMNLVSVILETETELENQFGLQLSLADEKAFSMRNSPFRTVDTFAQYIRSLAEA